MAGNRAEAEIEDEESWRDECEAQRTRETAKKKRAERPRGSCLQRVYGLRMENAGKQPVNSLFGSYK